MNLQNLFVHFPKHNAIVCSSFHHYFLQLFNNRLMFFTQISLSITGTVFCIIISPSTVPTSVCTVSASTVTSSSLQSSPWDSPSTCLFIDSSTSSDNQPLFLIAHAWSHTHTHARARARCFVDSNIPLSLHSLSILFLYPLTSFSSSSKGLLL